MGRRDAVQVTLEVIAEMRRLEPRLIVSYEPGWETRGNGTSANYEGALVHHTASASSLANPFPTQRVLRDGRPDLSGPLCNEAGPACTVDAPRIHVMSANPANHAGASGGRSMGPLPVTSLFNPRVRGLEIDYAGTVAMLAGQLYVAHIWAWANAKVVGGGDIERIRAHFETSITGKWDIGAGAGTKTYDMATFRRDAAATALQEDDMYSDTDRKRDDAIAIWTEWFGTPDDDPNTPANESAPNSKGEITKRIRDIANAQVAMQATLAALTRLVAEQNGLSLDDVRRVMAEEIAKGIAVDVTVNGSA